MKKLNTNGPILTFQITYLGMKTLKIRMIIVNIRISISKGNFNSELKIKKQTKIMLLRL